MRGRVHAHALVVAHGVDGVEDGGVRGEHDARVALVLVAAQVAARGVGQVFPVGAQRLAHQRDAVSEEQHVLHPPGAHEHVGEPRRHAGLAGARRHDQKPAPVPLVEVGARALDGLYLVVAVGAAAGDGGVHLYGCERAACAPAVDHALQVVAREHPAHAALGAALVVDEEGVETVGKEYQRAVAELCLQAVGVQPRLLLALLGRLAGALGLDQGERLAVLAQKQIVDVSRAGVVAGT